jgi:3,4-dihydroxy-2-butanone 4-phosphate synthase
MEEQALSVVLEAMKKGQCIAILDSESREVKTNLFFLAVFFFPLFPKNSKD